ncbi:MAG: sigma-70 family RNA polymerase sigma factor [Kofleriaceae bacterium]|nr:sigma-70 family RNA polymerase sigma factor [Myxococcales bacterium]MCB9559997.1 sigma-70 family RNA polymerase sigma factor [Kofleriaceae bacterium]
MVPASDPTSAYRTYGPALIRKAERVLRDRDDAVDVVHGLFVELIQRDAPTPAMDLPYLYRAVTNRCLNLLRDRANRERLLAREQQTVEDALAGARVRCDDHVIGTQLLVRLVERLDERHLEVLIARYVDDLTQEEIAELLGTSRKTVGKRLARIRAEVLALDARRPRDDQEARR